MKLIDLISKYNTKSVKGFPVSHMTGASVLGVALLAFSMSSPSNEKSLNEQSEKVLPLNIASLQSPISLPVSLPVSLPALPDSNNGNIAEPITPIEEVDTVRLHTETVKSGDSLSIIFRRAGLGNSVLVQFMKAHPDAKQLTKLHPGQTLTFSINKDDTLASLEFQKNRLDSIEFIRTEDGFDVKNHNLVPETYTAYREAIITDSLFLAGRKAGLDQSLIMEIANIFGWDVDFALDIRKNDSFKVLFEEQFLNGEKFRNGPILAVEFTNQGNTFRAVRYTDDNGVSNYYTPEGNSMRKAFLRTPVDFARISSHFNLSRKHPILNTIRAHKGTDYAAPTGTPIKAAGDGKVVFAGNKRGYGKTVIIQHGQTYKTLYAHMNNYGKGIKNGVRVKQSQIIGYVGSTGLATGPHLHYEFYVNGAVRNPVKVSLPKAQSIPKKQLAAFKLQTQPLVAKLDEFTEDNSPIQLANADNSI